MVSEHRVFVVSEAEETERLQSERLLKVLEEPPHYCTIILLCTRLEQLLPTTKSRLPDHSLRTGHQRADR